MFSCGPLHTNEQKLDDPLEIIYSYSVRTQDVALKICQMRWTIETYGKGESGKLVLDPRHDDDDDDDDDDDTYIYIYIYIVVFSLAQRMDAQQSRCKLVRIQNK